MGGRRPQTQQGGPRTARRRHQPFRQAAEFRLGGTRYQRRAGRARGHGRNGRGRPHRRAAKSRPGTRRASGRERVLPLRRFAGSEGVARTRAGFQRRARHCVACRIAGRVASVSKGRLRFSLPPHPYQTRRHSGRRHGSGQNAAGAGVAGVAQGAQHEKSQAIARHLPRVRAAQLAARSEPVYAKFEGARARKRRGTA